MSLLIQLQDFEASYLNSLEKIIKSLFNIKILEIQLVFDKKSLEEKNLDPKEKEKIKEYIKKVIQSLVQKRKLQKVLVRITINHQSECYEFSIIKYDRYDPIIEFESIYENN